MCETIKEEIYVVHLDLENYKVIYTCAKLTVSHSLRIVYLEESFTGETIFTGRCIYRVEV